MDYEKKYKDALEKARKSHDKANGLIKKEWIETIFPELKESEDEKIRKQILGFLKEFECDHYRNLDFSSWIAWLEKQGEQKIKHSNEENYEIDGLCYAKTILKKTLGKVEGFQTDDGILLEHKSAITAVEKLCEQKPTDAIEPKFKVVDIMRTLQEATDNITSGLPIIVSIDKEYYHCTNELIAIQEQDDYEYPPMNRTQNPTDAIELRFKIGDWVVNKFGHVWHIDSFDNKNYQVSNEKGDDCYFKISDQDEMHLWTIADAKDGDILNCNDKINTDCPFIFHNLNEESNPRSYCGVNTLGLFQYNDENNGIWCKSSEVKPATKEQRDLLFQKMKDAGYEWNAEKKKLKWI